MILSGTTTTRLSELRRYKVTDTFSESYLADGSFSKSGVDFDDSVEGEYITYYINGIKYTDVISNGVTETIFYFIPKQEISVDSNILKLSIGKTITPPKIENDVFIERQSVSVFKENQMLGAIDNLLDLLTFGGGGYFNIVKNT